MEPPRTAAQRVRSRAGGVRERRRAAEIRAFDLAAFLASTGLQSNLTTGRRNGLAEMIRRLRQFAAGLPSAK